MTRQKLRMTIDAPAGGTVERLCEALREMGYTVTPGGRGTMSRLLYFDVITPHGEVSDRRFIGGKRRRA